jgi:hypothetical protein
MRTASESPIKLSGKSLIESQQGTMHFMSIEAATQKFLFCPLLELDMNDDLSSVPEGDGPAVGTAPADVPFFPNHLHDLESL